jgi:hypothetical protein
VPPDSWPQHPSECGVPTRPQDITPLRLESLQRAPEPFGRQHLDFLPVSTLRESFERASLPALTYLNGLPRFVPFVGILVLALAGILLPSPGWLLIVVVIAVLAWILALAWPRLSGAERLMRLAVVAIMVAVLVTQVAPRS